MVCLFFACYSGRAWPRRRHPGTAALDHERAAALIALNSRTLGVRGLSEELRQYVGPPTVGGHRDSPGSSSGTPIPAASTGELGVGWQSGVPRVLRARGGVESSLAATSGNRTLRDSDKNAAALARGIGGFSQLADVALTFGEEDDSHAFAVHRVVVAARSAWFARVLQQSRDTSASGVAEASSTQTEGPVRVVARTVRAECGRPLVEFLYTGRYSASVAQEPDLLLSVLEAADMLGMPRLLTLCERDLAKFIDESSVVGLFLAADWHHARQLAEACLYFLRRNYDLVAEDEARAAGKKKDQSVRNLLSELPEFVAEECKEACRRFREAREQTELKRQEYVEQRPQNFIVVKYEDDSVFDIYPDV